MVFTVTSKQRLDVKFISKTLLNCLNVNICADFIVLQGIELKIKSSRMMKMVYMNLRCANHLNREIRYTINNNY
mgnify:CR=1 FL=1